MTWKIILAESPNQKTEAAACILRALPDWLGNIQARESYIKQSAALPVLIAYDRQQPISLHCRKLLPLLVKSVLWEFFLLIIAMALEPH